MFISMACSCGAELEVGDSETSSNDTLVTLWGHQFVNAHKGCGFMSHEHEEKQEKSTRFNINYKEKREKEL